MGKQGRQILKCFFFFFIVLGVNFVSETDRTLWKFTDEPDPPPFLEAGTESPIFKVGFWWFSYVYRPLDQNILELLIGK